MGGEDGCEGRVEVFSGLITVKFVNSVGQRMLHLSGKSQGKSGNLRDLWLWQPCYYITVVTWPQL